MAHKSLTEFSPRQPVSAASRSEDRNLDVLRAIAVLFVFVGHLLDFWCGGAAVLGDWLHGMTRMGVILFFVHTSLVLMQSLERLAPGNPHFMREFYIRRIFRIYPLAICSIVVALVFRIPWRHGMTAWVAVPSAKQVISNLLLIQNITHQESIISPLWSLPLEVQMYVVLPFLFILFSSRVRWISYMVAAWGDGYFPYLYQRRPDPNYDPVANGVMSWDLYREMWGSHGEFVIDGNLKSVEYGDRLKTIAVPTLIVAGDHDECDPVQSQEMQQKIEGSKLVILPQSGHMTFVDQPGLYLKAVGDFLK